jgi:hypothetical protein
MSKKRTVIYDSMEYCSEDWNNMRNAVMTGNTSLVPEIDPDDLKVAIEDVAYFRKDGREAKAKQACDEFIIRRQAEAAENEYENFKDRLKEYDARNPNTVFIMVPVIQLWTGIRYGIPQYAESLFDCYKKIADACRRFNYELRVVDTAGNLNIQIIHHDGTNNHYVVKLRHKTIRNINPKIEDFASKVEVTPDYLYALGCFGRGEDARESLNSFIRRHCCRVDFVGTVF